MGNPQTLCSPEERQQWHMQEKTSNTTHTITTRTEMTAIKVSKVDKTGCVGSCSWSQQHPPACPPPSSTPHLLDKPEEVPVGGPHWRSLCGVQGASSTSPWGHLEKRETGHVQHLGVPSTDPSRTRSFTQLTGAGTSGTSRRNGPGSRRCRACRHIGCCGRLGRDSAPPGLRARGEVALTPALPCSSAPFLR